MTLETYKEIYHGKPTEKILDLLSDEAYYISCDARDYGISSADHNEEMRKYYSSEVEHHKMRFAWLISLLMDQFVWVKVEDRLPENPYEAVIVSIRTTNGNGDPATWETIGYYDNGNWVLVDGRFEENETVTHWMPMPRPPEAESNE